jgi:hypothetical protein
MHASLTVRVLDAASLEPLPGAQVAVFLRPPEKGLAPRLVEGLSGSDGTARFEVSLSPGERLEALPVVRARGRREWRPPELSRRFESPPGGERLWLAPGSQAACEVRLERGVTLAGVVTDSRGQPLAGARIGLICAGPSYCTWPYAFSMSGKLHWPPLCATDERGAFEWLSFPLEDALEGEHWVLTAEHPRAAPAMAHDVEKLAPDAGGVIHLRLACGEGCSLRGRVLAPGGEPCAAAHVQARAEPAPDQPFCIRFAKEAATDAAGAFELLGLPQLRHRLEAACEGCAPRVIDVDLSRGAGEPLEIRLEAGCDLEGTIVDAEGKPLAGLELTAVLAESRAFRTATSDASGRFRLAGLPARGSLELSAAGRFERTLDLPSPALAIRLPRPVTLEARLVAAENGAPLEPPAHLRYSGVGVSSGIEMEEGGRVRREGLAPGRYRLEVLHEHRPPIGIDIELPEGGLAEPLVIPVPQGATVSGRVTDLGGKPLAGVAVACYHEPIEDRREESDASGHYRVSGLGPRACLVFRLAGFALRALPVATSPGEVLTLDVVMGPGGAVRGRVSGADGTPLAGERVRIRPEGCEHPLFELPAARTGGDGRYELRHVPEGAMVIGVRSEARPLAVRHGEEAAIDFTI